MDVVKVCVDNAVDVVAVVVVVNFGELMTVEAVLNPPVMGGCAVRTASIAVVAEVLEPVLVRFSLSIFFINASSASNGRNMTRI